MKKKGEEENIKTWYQKKTKLLSIITLILFILVLVQIILDLLFHINIPGILPLTIIILAILLIRIFWSIIKKFFTLRYSD